MTQTILYRTTARATGGREGRAATTDGSLDVALVMPKELGGPGGAGTNPEQLLAAGYAACFLSALKYSAGQAKVKLPPEAAISAEVGIGPRADGGFGLEVALRAELPGLDPAVADELLATAHAVCPYSHATRGNITVTVARA